MSNENTTPAATLAQLQQVASADDTTLATAHHKLPTWLRERVDTSKTALAAAAPAVSTTEGERRAQSERLKDAYAEGESLVREVSRFLNVLPRGLDAVAVRRHYGLADALPRYLSNDAIEGLLAGFITAHTQPLAPEAALRGDIVTAIQETQAAIAANKVGATTGARQQVVSAKNAAWDAGEDAVRRVWYFLCATLDGKSADGGLTRYGFTPRQ